MNIFNSYTKILYILPLFLITSCVAEKTNEDVLKRIVSKYVAFIPAAYRYGDFESFREVAAGKALEVVSETYDAFRHGNSMILKSELQSLVFNDIVLGTTKENTGVKVEWNEKEKEWKEIFVSGESIVKTTEIWTFNWIDIKTGGPASPIVKSEYDLKYTLKWLDDGTLKVVHVEVEREDVVDTVDTGAEWNIEGGALVHGMKQ